MPGVLLLGGTTEAAQMARALAEAGVDAIYSYAGRTESPMAQPLPLRVGGFGGVAGLADYLQAEEITHVIDATHPFAAQMSLNAISACTETGTPLIVLERAPWVAGAGDDWTHVPDIPAAVAALSGPPRRMFLAIGRQHLAPFAAQGQHRYLLRLVDPPTDPLPLPQADVVIARGPFHEADDIALLQAHRIDLVVAKNAGGKGAVAKIAAARALKLPVLMIDRPVLPPRRVAHEVPEVMAWLHA